MRKLPKDLALGDLNDHANDGQQARRQPHSISEVYMMRRASKSFENLIALANDQERRDAVSKVARKAVWRDVGEPPVQLDTLWECLEHASRGGLREFSSLCCLLSTRACCTVARGSCHQTSYSRTVITFDCNISPFFSKLGAGMLAGAIRSGVNIFLLLFRIMRAPKYVLRRHQNDLFRS